MRELYFIEADDHDDRTTVAKAFANFWKESNDDKLEIPEKYKLGGKVFGRKRLNDGDEIFTSNIKFVERIERNSHDGISHNLMCATTISGSKITSTWMIATPICT